MGAEGPLPPRHPNDARGVRDSGRRAARMHHWSWLDYWAPNGVAYGPQGKTANAAVTVVHTGVPDAAYPASRIVIAAAGYPT